MSVSFPLSPFRNKKSNTKGNGEAGGHSQQYFSPVASAVTAQFVQQGWRPLPSSQDCSPKTSNDRFHSFLRITSPLTLLTTPPQLTASLTFLEKRWLGRRRTGREMSST